MFIGEKAISSTIFTLDDFKHIFRAFLAAAFQPEFYDVGNARFEKLHVIFNKSVSEMYAGKGSIIADDFIIVVISQLKIGIIKDLIIPGVGLESATSCGIHSIKAHIWSFGHTRRASAPTPMTLSPVTSGK